MNDMELLELDYKAPVKKGIDWMTLMEKFFTMGDSYCPKRWKKWMRDEVIKEEAVKNEEE